MLVETAIDVTAAHIDRRTGLVWAASGDGRPTPTGLDPDRFAAALTRGPVRVLGTRGNAPLLSALCRHALSDPDLVIQVGRPTASAWDAIDEEGPGHVLLTMREYAAGPTSLGGWHRLRGRERGAYALTALLDAGPVDPMHLRAALGAHPAWPALSFVSGLAEGPVAALLAEVVDPRWFADHADPDKAGKLQHYLGLTPANAKVRKPRKPSAARLVRRSLVLACWAGSPPADPSAPGHFLWRHRDACGLLGPAADLAASRRFLAFLEGTWAEAVGPPPRIRRGAGIRGDQGLFVADHFFADPVDAAAYRAHRDLQPS